MCLRNHSELRQRVVVSRPAKPRRHERRREGRPESQERAQGSPLAAEHSSAQLRPAHLRAAGPGLVGLLDEPHELSVYRRRNPLGGGHSHDGAVQEGNLRFAALPQVHQRARVP